VYAYFDPELSFDRECGNGKMEKGLDRRLSTRSSDRIMAKSNKTGIVRTKTYPHFSPERNGSYQTASHSRTNSFKDRKYSERDMMEDLVNVSADTYVSCAVGRKRSAARYFVENVNEVVSFVKSLADACPCECPDELDSEDQSVSSVSSGSGHHVFAFSADSFHI
jgi:trehalose 6-phosphate synthase/phosphatase